MLNSCGTNQESLAEINPSINLERSGSKMNSRLEPSQRGRNISKTFGINSNNKKEG